jgi:hypothetical protein
MKHAFDITSSLYELEVSKSGSRCDLGMDSTRDMNVLNRDPTMKKPSTVTR